MHVGSETSREGECRCHRDPDLTISVRVHLADVVSEAALHQHHHSSMLASSRDILVNTEARYIKEEVFLGF